MLKHVQNIMMGSNGNVVDRKCFNNMFVELLEVAWPFGCIVADLLVFGNVENDVNMVNMST